MSVELRWFTPFDGVTRLQYRQTRLVKPGGVSTKGVIGMPIHPVYEWSEWKDVPIFRELSNGQISEF